MKKKSGVQEILCFIPRIFKIWRPLPCQLWAAISYRKWPANWSECIYIQNYCEDELLSNLQRMGCSESGKPHFFLNTLYIIFAGTWLRWWCWCWTGPSIRTTLMTTPGKFFLLWNYQIHPSIIYLFFYQIPLSIHLSCLSKLKYSSKYTF